MSQNVQVQALAAVMGIKPLFGEKTFMSTIIETQSNDQPTVRGKGRLLLQPIAGSVDRSTLELEIDLHHNASQLTVGDLVRSAEKLTAENNFEPAYRLWTVVQTAADRAHYTDLATHALAQADGAQNRAQFIKATERRTDSHADRSTTKYDYEGLFADVTGGMTKTATARKWGCSPSTVQRAVDYVTERNELLDQSPEVLDQIMAGVDLKTLSGRYDVSTKVLRWMVNTDHERRR